MILAIKDGAIGPGVTGNRRENDRAAAVESSKPGTEISPARRAASRGFDLDQEKEASNSQCYALAMHARGRMAQYRLATRIFLFLFAPAALWFAAATVGAAEIRILSPQQEETVHNNSGNVTVAVQARLGAGEHIRLLLDGSPQAPDSDRGIFALEGIDRGEHKLQALLMSDKDEILARSKTVTFYMWRASAQFPTRKPPPPPPPKH